MKIEINDKQQIERRNEMRISIRLAKYSDMTSKDTKKYHKRNPDKLIFITSYKGHEHFFSETITLSEMISSLKQSLGEI